MRLGYFAMPLHPPGADPARTMDDDLVQLATLDRLGYEEAWIGEHFTAQWENIPCPDLFIAKALAMTSTIKLATGVSCLPNHTPLMLALRIAQLDQMARGRFYWGVGSGGLPGDLQLAGVGRAADRSTWRIARDVYVADTDEQARREAIGGTLGRDYREYFLRLLPKLRGFDMLKADPAMPDAQVTLEYLCDNIWLVGSPRTVAKKIAALHETVGGFGLVLAIAHEWQPREAWERSMTLLAREVRPLVANLR